MLPVRMALMNGLWRTILTGDLTSAINALRILGKFGGSNRKILLDSQTINFHIQDDLDSIKLMLPFYHKDHKIESISLTDIQFENENKPKELCISFSVNEIIQNAVAILRLILGIKLFKIMNQIVKNTSI